MRHYGRRRRRSSGSPRPRIQHSPNSVANTILTNDQLVTFSAVATVVAGTSAGTSRVDSDRATEISGGSKIPSVTWDVALRNLVDDGVLEYCVFKAERQAVTPVKGTFPIPADAALANNGMQQEYRLNMPGWIMKFGIVPFSPETPKVFKVKVNLAKFKKQTWRDGDFLGLVFFNRSPQSLTLDWHARYYEYK